MKKISIYNSFVKNNDTKREYIKKQLKSSGFMLSREGDLLLVIGGDGTFLSAIRKRLHENPVFAGFNTGNLGFLSEFTVEQIDDFIQMIKNGEYWIQEYPVYEVRMKEAKSRTEHVEYFVNDLVVERKSSRILHMSVHFGNEEVCTVSADGIIISTPLGSTGYGMSAGGSIILDSKDILQLTPISPVRSSAYQSLSTPIIFNDNNDVTIFPSYKKQRIFRIVCDGKEIRTNQIRYVDIKKSDKVLRILRSKNYSTTKNIKNKILDEE